MSFNYQRKYHISDLYKYDTFLATAESVEFYTFEDFVKYYLNHEEMSSCSTISKLIVPVSTATEMETLFQLKTVLFPFTMIYLKTVSEEILSKITGELGNTSLMIDSENIIPFRECLKTCSEEVKAGVCEYLKHSYGYFRNHLNYDNKSQIANKVLDPFKGFPYFCVSYFDIDFASFEDVKLKELREIVYQYKYIYTNGLNRQHMGALCWGDFGGSDTDVLNYKFDLYHPSKVNKFYVKDGLLGVSFDSELPTLNLEEEASEQDIDAVYGLFSIEFPGDYWEFISKEQNYKCNKNVAQLPYLNRIINNILRNGDV